MVVKSGSWGGWLLLAGVLLAAAAPAWAQDAAGAAADTAVATGGVDGIYGYHLPPVVTERGEQIDRLMAIMHVFMIVLFVGWGIFFVYCLVRFRARPGHSATSQLPKAVISKYAEAAVMVIEVVLLTGFSYPIWAGVKTDVPADTDPNAFRVRCVAEQFAWNFHYPGPDGRFGRTDAKLMSASNPLGRDFADPSGSDDIATINELRVPVDKPVIVMLSSKDVIHSFNIPVARVKQDAIPGMQFPVWFQAHTTGAYEIACAQLCGNNHFKMKGRILIQPAEEVEEWVKAASVPEVFEE